LRSTNIGKSVIFTPFSILFHYEGKTRGQIDVSEEEKKAKKLFRQKHEKIIERGDPFYNPNLSLMVPFETNFFSLDKPIQLLADIYDKRKDLQEKWPNEHKIGFKNMIDWAATHGIVLDNSKELLARHYQYYFYNCSKDAKPLAKKIQKYLNNEELRMKFPEVENGIYDNFLKHLEN